MERFTCVDLSFFYLSMEVFDFQGLIWLLARIYMVPNRER